MILRLSKQFVSVGIYVIMGLVTIKKGMSVSLFCSEICQGRSIVLISRFLRIFSAVFNKRSYCFSYIYVGFCNNVALHLNMFLDGTHICHNCYITFFFHISVWNKKYYRYESTLQWFSIQLLSSIALCSYVLCTEIIYIAVIEEWRLQSLELIEVRTSRLCFR